MVIEVKPEQPWNARSPMFATLFGMAIEVKPEQPLKAEFPMLVTPLGMITEVAFFEQEITTLSFITNP